MQLPGDLGHLTYCTNIHPAETWGHMRAELARHLPAIREDAAPGRPFGVGLRIAAAAADALQDPQAFDDLKTLLDEQDCHVFTLNGFPFGSFHGARVKEQVYAPDWAQPERLRYTDRLADILARLLPDGMAGSISTVPGSYKPWADEARIEALTRNLLRHAAHLVEIEARTGRSIALALEPEPSCLIETIEETADFFETSLYDSRAAAFLADAAGLTRGAAADALRRHLGVCYDVCHAAVEFEDPRESVERLRARAIPVPKLQLSAALKVESMSRAAAEHLAPFDEPVYLHQVVERGPDGLRRFRDLPEALARIDDAEGREWRVHFHVPIFLDRMEHFATTQDFLRDILRLHRERPISPHLEVETYTWDVLPERYRGVPVSAAISRELRWVMDQLGDRP